MMEASMLLLMASIVSVVLCAAALTVQRRELEG
jgi:hypothetical protein